MGYDYTKLLNRDMPEIVKHWDIFNEIGMQYQIDPALLAAIASRESGIGQLLDGEHKGDSGHGHGWMQIDDRSFGGWLKSAAWWIPKVNVEQGAKVLKEKIKQVMNYGAPADLALQIGLAGYNQGAWGAWQDYKKYGDPDKTTTGRNYSKDVFKRAELIRQAMYGIEPEKKSPLIWAGIAAGIAAAIF